MQQSSEKRDYQVVQIKEIYKTSSSSWFLAGLLQVKCFATNKMEVLPEVWYQMRN